MYINSGTPPSGATTQYAPNRAGLGHDRSVPRQQGEPIRSVTPASPGASLSGGKVKGDCVTCRSRWHFNGEGRSRDPSLGQAREPRAHRGRIDSYPVEERYGLIHVFLGDLPAAERPPILEVAEYGEKGWRHTIVDYAWEANYERNIENGLDPAHNEFVHPTHGYSGEKEDYKVGDPVIESTPWGFGFAQLPAPRSESDHAPCAQIRRRPRGRFGPCGPSNMWTKIH